MQFNQQNLCFVNPNEMIFDQKHSKILIIYNYVEIWYSTFNSFADGIPGFGHQQKYVPFKR